MPGLVLAQALPGPRSLFPELPSAPAEPALPEPLPDQTVETPAIGVAPLAPPGLAASGVPRAEEALGGPLWAGAAPAALAARIARLPARIDDPVLRRLQRDLLLAPGPAAGAGADVVRARVDRLLAMGEALAAAELLTVLPPSPAGEELDDLRVAAMLAADQVAPGCGIVDQVTDETAPWPAARLVCAALQGDDARVELLLSLMTERGQPADPLLASLANAVGSSERVALREPPPADPLLLPLLRRAPLQPQPRAIADAPPAAAPGPGARTRPSRPGSPRRRPSPACSPPIQASTAARPPTGSRPCAPCRHRCGRAGSPPSTVWAQARSTRHWRRCRLPPRRCQGGKVDLVAWRGLEQAMEEQARGATLLELLILLEGRPAAAAPLALRAALSGLRSLGLDADARAVAAAGLVG